MANRNFEKNIYNLTKGLTLLCGQFDVGATGAVTAATTKGNGITSIARSAAGKYLITLDDQYKDLRNFGWSADELATAATSGVDGAAAISADDATLGVPNKLLSIQFRLAGTATDPANGVRIKFQLLLRNSSVKIKGE